MANRTAEIAEKLQLSIKFGHRTGLKLMLEERLRHASLSMRSRLIAEVRTRPVAERKCAGGARGRRRLAIHSTVGSVKSLRTLASKPAITHSRDARP